MAPPFSRPELEAALEAGAQFRYRPFWGHHPRRAGVLDQACLSQWWPCRFEVDGVVFPSAEHFMMAAKARLFHDDAAYGSILASATPAEAKRLGRKVRNYDDRRWAANRFDLVTAGNVAKFGQDGALRAFLLGTGEDILVEASPEDTIWGIGLPGSDARVADPTQWLGQNLLGFALVRARAILRGELPGVVLAVSLGE